MRTPLQSCALVLCCPLRWSAAAGCSATTAIVQGHSPLRPARPSPDSVTMEIIWARFPAGDPALNDDAWHEIDETQIAPGRPPRAGEQRLPRRRDRRHAARRDCPRTASRRGAAERHRPKRIDGKPSSSRPIRSFTAACGSCAAISASEIQASEVYRIAAALDRAAAASWAAARSASAGHLCAASRSAARSHGARRADARAALRPAALRWTGGDDGVLRQAPLREREVFDRLRMKVKLAPGEMLVLDEPAGCRQPAGPILSHRRLGRRPAAKADSHPPGRSAAERHVCRSAGE